MRDSRVSTGMGSLDLLIGGGFSKGSLILLAGSPGTGKTIFGAQFICKGVSLGEPGVYVSFAEDKETFLHNMSEHLGRGCVKCVERGKCVFLDFVTVKEKGVSTILESIVSKVEEVKARRLVIDSYSAMAQAFERPIDARVVLHTVLSRITRRLGCTTVLTVEVPTGKEEVGLGAEEFVADGVILLRRKEVDGRLLRELEIVKLRGTSIRRHKCLFTLKGGFIIFSQFEAKQIETPKRFQPTPDPEARFSTGNSSMDEMLGGGYKRGSYAVIDVGEAVPYEAYRLLTRPTVQNFLMQGRGVTWYPSSGVDPKYVRKYLIQSIGEDVVNRLARFFVKKARGAARSEPGYVEYEGLSLEKDATLRLGVRLKLEEATGQPSLSIWGRDDYEATYGAKVRQVFARAVAEDMSRGALNIDICKPAVKDAQPFRDAATYHFKLQLVNGVVVVYLVKPFGGAYCLEGDASKGYHEPKLTPIL